MEQEKTDLELLEEQYAALQEEIASMNRAAYKTMSALQHNAREVPSFNAYQFRQHQDKLKRQLKILESRVRRERDRVLKQRRAEKKQELETLQIDLNAAKARYHEAQEILERAWTAHAQLEVRAYNVEEGLRIDYEDMRSNQRALQNLIREITGLDELAHDGLPQTENLLIRN